MYLFIIFSLVSKNYSLVILEYVFKNEKGSLAFTAKEIRGTIKFKNPYS